MLKQKHKNLILGAVVAGAFSVLLSVPAQAAIFMFEDDVLHPVALEKEFGKQGVRYVKCAVAVSVIGGSSKMDTIRLASKGSKLLDLDNKYGGAMLVTFIVGKLSVQYDNYADGKSKRDLQKYGYRQFNLNHCAKLVDLKASLGIKG